MSTCFCRDAKANRDELKQRTFQHPVVSSIINWRIIFKFTNKQMNSSHFFYSKFQVTERSITIYHVMRAITVRIEKTFLKIPKK